LSNNSIFTGIRLTFTPAEQFRLQGGGQPNPRSERAHFFRKRKAGGGVICWDPIAQLPGCPKTGVKCHGGQVIKRPGNDPGRVCCYFGRVPCGTLRGGPAYAKSASEDSATARFRMSRDYKAILFDT
jgi:hypothetical protein